MSDEDPQEQEAQPASHFPRLMASIGTGAVLASVALVIGVTVKSGSPDMLPEAAAAPSTSTTASSTPTATSSSTSSSSSSSYPSDKQGYVDSKARCDASQIVMAYGRTEHSLVAICVDPDGELEYRGVRLSDKASLQISAGRGSDGSVIATNDGVTYSISPKVFLVSEGDNVLYRDPWIEFQQPGFSGEASTSAGPTTSGSPTTTVSTTTVTVTTSVTPTTSKAGG